MNIKEAARQTGLTKKAIKYYEQEGLITVSKNPDNGYREYSAQNVNTLKMIAALRMLALSVSDIKAFLLEGSSLHDILRQQHQKLSRQIEELEQERKLTEMLIKRVEDAENVDSILHDIGEVKIDEPKYMGLQLKKLFPGDFGEFIAALFEPFLDFSIDTDEKKAIWAELINGGVLMSRIGKKAVEIPSGVTAAIDGGQLSVKGPKGTLAMPLSDNIKYEVGEGSISVQPANDTREARAFWGMQRTLVQNLVTGVTEGFTKVLEITGVGYRANSQGKTLKLQLGYSHDVDFAVPEGIEIKTPDNTTIEISGIDKQKVGQVAAEIRRWRKPEPYKGKGIKYRGEYIFRKEGKKK